MDYFQNAIFTHKNKINNIGFMLIYSNITSLSRQQKI